MKKLLFVMDNLGLGGIQKSLANLLNEIKDMYEIDLVVFNKEGEVRAEIPSSVKVTELSFPIKNLGISFNQSKEYGLKQTVISFLLRLITKLGHKKCAMKYVLKHTPKNSKKYDVAIAYRHSPDDKSFHSGCNEYVLNNVDADKKISFLHADYIKSGSNTMYNKQLLLQFDNVVAVSQNCKEVLASAVPEIEEKIVVVNNCVNYKAIREKATITPDITFNKGEINLITVARLSEEKGLLRMVPAIKKLVDNNVLVHYYIVGDGPLKNTLESEIEKNNLSESITLLGAQSNPYQYIKQADLFVLPSYQEAESVSIKEALGLQVPVLSTETISARKMVNSEQGFVCENNDDSLINSLYDIVTNEKYLQKQKNLQTFVANDDESVNQFNNLITT